MLLFAMNTLLSIIWRRQSALLAALSISVLAVSAQSQPAAPEPELRIASAPRNVILFIGDGMGDQQITIARNYLAGARGRILLDDMPLRSAVQVLTVDAQGKPIYVADSANSATSMATGAVTVRRRIAMAADGKTALPTILQQAMRAGLRTGLVTTSSVTDATPASFVAHMSIRHCENPTAMLGARVGFTTLPHCKHLLKAAGGPGSISEQIAAAPVDIVLGGGRKHFDTPREDSEEHVLQLAAQSGFALPATLEDARRIPQNQRILGLFAESHLPERWRGEAGRSSESPRPSWANALHRYLGSVTLPEIIRCEHNPAFADAPTLVEMTDVALSRLPNPNGFFLMVESASIDKAAHQRRACGSIGELKQLLEALALALDFAEQQGNTLVLVTADHGQAAQLIPQSSYFASYGIPVFTPGMLTRLQTPEGGIMGVNYATNNFSYEEHTGVNVPLFANAEGLGRVPAMIRQPDLYQIMFDYLLGDSP